MTSNEMANAIEELGLLISAVNLSFHMNLGHNFSQSSKKIIFLLFVNLVNVERNGQDTCKELTSNIHWLTWVPCHLDTLR